MVLYRSPNWIFSIYGTRRSKIANRNFDIFLFEKIKLLILETLQLRNWGIGNWNIGCFLLENIEHRISGIWNVGNWKLGICKLENQVFFNAKHRICGMQNVENGKSMDKMCWFIELFSITSLTYEMYDWKNVFIQFTYYFITTDKWLLISNTSLSISITSHKLVLPHALNQVNLVNSSCISFRISISDGFHNYELVLEVIYSDLVDNWQLIESTKIKITQCWCNIVDNVTYV